MSSINDRQGQHLQGTSREMCYYAFIRQGQHLQGTSSEMCHYAVTYSSEILHYRSAVSGGYRFPVVFGIFRILMSARKIDLLTENYHGFSLLPYKSYGT
jgi:ribosome modulation factor